MDTDDEQEFQVVGSIAGQLSVWPVGVTVPDGWTPVGYSGPRERCLTWVGHRGEEPGAWGGADRGTLVSMFIDAVGKHGQRCAVSDGDMCLTYEELDARSSRLAAQLAASGLGAEDRVAICLRRGIDVLIAVIGILKAGGAYVPIDPRYPMDRRDLMVGHSGARIVLTEPGWSNQFGELSSGVEVWEWTSGGSDREPRGIPGNAGGSGQASAACVLFTSGSSGVPKGVVLEQAGIAAFARNPVFAGLTEDDRIAHISSVSFDAFHFELWCGIAAGAELVVLPQLSDLLGTDVRRELRRRRITAMLVPTMALNHLLREDRDTFDSIRLLYTGGDVLTRQTCVDLLGSAFSGRFVNLYGPTEATTACAGYEVRQVGPAHQRVPIGTALEGYRVTVRHSDMSPAAVGDTGELYIGGAGVARGYLGNPGLTADRFRPDPDGPRGARMYATGDLARLRPDGLLEFRGRLDDQAKIRGFRVEVGEVEQAIARHPRVSDVAVLAAGEGHERYLALFVVALRAITPAELRAHAADVLPEHMIPQVILVVDAIPSTEHGKRDRDQLSAWLQQHRQRADNYIEPATDTERYVAELWGSLLAIDRVGTADDFFELGGHSLLAFRVQRRIRKELGIDLDFGDLLSNSVLRDLAQLISAQHKEPT